MKVDREQLEARFQDMSDEELLRRAASGELTELALDVLGAEAARRGLRLEYSPAEEASAGGAAVPAQGPLVICGRFLLPLDAQVFAARLQAEGLAAQCMDVNTIYAVGAFMGGLARGGVRVMVPQSQLELALRIRERFDAGEFALGDDFRED